MITVVVVAVVVAVVDVCVVAVVVIFIIWILIYVFIFVCQVHSCLLHFLLQTPDYYDVIIVNYILIIIMINVGFIMVNDVMVVVL